MSLHPEDPTSPPEETRRVARAAFPKGTLCLDIADALGAIYQDSQFAALFAQVGQPAAAPAMLALACSTWKGCLIVRLPMPCALGSIGSTLCGSR
jgi:hypothetical protein